MRKQTVIQLRKQRRILVIQVNAQNGVFSVKQRKRSAQIDHRHDPRRHQDGEQHKAVAPKDVLTLLQRRRGLHSVPSF